MFNILFSRAILAIKLKVLVVLERCGLVLKSEYVKASDYMDCVLESAEHKELFEVADRCYDHLRLNYDGLLQRQNSMLDVNSSWKTLEKAWIDHHIDTMERESSASCGSYYELYEKRKQSYVERFLTRKCQGLSKEGLEYLKQKTGYSKDFIPYTEVCETTGNILTIETIIERSME